MHIPYPISDKSGQNLYPISDQNGSKTIVFGVAHIYMAYIREYPPPPRGILVVELGGEVVKFCQFSCSAVSYQWNACACAESPERVSDE